MVLCCLVQVSSAFRLFQLSRAAGYGPTTPAAASTATAERELRSHSGSGGGGADEPRDDGHGDALRTGHDGQGAGGAEEESRQVRLDRPAQVLLRSGHHIRGEKAG